MRRRNPFDKSRSPGFLGYIAGAMMGFAFGAIAGWGPGYAAGKSALAGPWEALLGWLGPTLGGWYNTAKGLAALAGGAEFAFFGGLVGTVLACVLVALRVPLSLILAGGACLALVSWLVFLAVR